MAEFFETKRPRIDYSALFGGMQPGLQRGITAQSDIQSQLLPLLFKAQLERQSQKQSIQDYLDMAAKTGNGPDGEYSIKIGDITYKQPSKKEQLESRVASERLGAQVPQPIAEAMGGEASPVPQSVQDAMGEQDFILNPNFATGGDKFIKNPKLSASKEKQLVEATELGNQAQSLIDLFRTGQEEGKTNIEGFGATGMGGRLAGRQASILGAMGKKELPSLNIYNRKKKAFATVVAKAAGEVRPTDEDIKRFMGTLPDFNLSDAENEIVIDQLKKDITSKGYKNVWTERVGKRVTKSGISYTVEK